MSSRIEKCLAIIKKIEAVEAPIYERRITKQQFMQDFGFVANSVAHRTMKCDQLAPKDLSVKAIDDRFQYAMQSEGS